MAESDLDKVLEEFKYAKCPLCYLDTNDCQCTEDSVFELAVQLKGENAKLVLRVRELAGELADTKEQVVYEQDMTATYQEDSKLLKAEAERLTLLVRGIWSGESAGSSYAIAIEAALTAAVEAGDKAGYERGWDDARTAAVGYDQGVEAAEKAEVPTYSEWGEPAGYRAGIKGKNKAIRRLKKGQV